MKKRDFKKIKFILYTFIMFCFLVQPINLFASDFTIVGKTISCNSIPRTMEILKDIFKYVRIFSVVIFIVLTSFDYVGAIASSEKDGFKKSNKHLVTRLIVLIVILILPSIVNLLLTIIQLNNGNCVIK